MTQLGVQRGDTVTVSAQGYYEQAVQHSFWFSLGSWLASLVGQQPAPVLGPDPNSGSAHPRPLLQLGLAAGLPALTQLNHGVPKGYLRVLVFDQDSVLVDQQTRQLSPAAQYTYEQLSAQVVLAQDGYVTVYVGNESDVDVYFDDVTVERRQGLQVQENHYEPWGLSLVGLDYSSPSTQSLNYYQFNGKERQRELGLAWSDYGARFYDPARGPVWLGVDPLADKMRRWSPYAFAFDNPLRFLDYEGLKPTDIIIRNEGQNVKYVDGKLSNPDGTAYAGKVEGFLKKSVEALNKIRSTSSGGKLVNELQSSKNTYTITSVRDKGNPRPGKENFMESNRDAAFANQLNNKVAGGSGGTVYWNPQGAEVMTTNGFFSNGVTDLGHELSHALDANRGLLDDRTDFRPDGSSDAIKRDEWQAVYRENMLRGELGRPLRTRYSGQANTDGNFSGGPLMIIPGQSGQPAQPILPPGYIP